MLNVLLWLGVAYVSAFIVFGLAAAMLSMTTEETERLMDQDVRR